MAGTTALLGITPLAIAHVIGFAILVSLALNGRATRRGGVLYGIGAPVVASALGLIVTLVLTGGELIVPAPSYAP